MSAPDQDIPEARGAAEKLIRIGNAKIDQWVEIISAACREYAERLRLPLESSRPQSQWQELQQRLSSLQKENEELKRKPDIGPDPLKADGEERKRLHEETRQRLRRAFTIQQSEVADQTRR